MVIFYSKAIYINYNYIYESFNKMINNINGTFCLLNPWKCLETRYQERSHAGGVLRVQDLEIMQRRVEVNLLVTFP